MKGRLYLAALGVVGVLVMLVAGTAFATPGGPNALNAQFMFWQEQSRVIHIAVLHDDGRPGSPPAASDTGQPVVFGYEYGGETDTVDDLNNMVLKNLDFDLALSVDGGTPFSVKSGFQPAFEAATKSGPRWSWDHDGDGAGDGDGDGIGDWNGPVMFFRYAHPGLDAGTHTFEFFITYTGGTLYEVLDTVTVEVGP